MYCGKCGQELEKGSKFCTNCGNLVGNMSERSGLSENEQNEPYLYQSDIAQSEWSNGKKRGRVLVFAILFLAIGIIGGIYGLHSYFSGKYVAFAIDKEGKYVLINEKGENINGDKYDYTIGFSGGDSKVAVVAVKKDSTMEDDVYELTHYSCKLIDKKGNTIADLSEYDKVGFISGFSKQGLMSVAKQNGVDSEGEPKYEWGFIDTKGREVISCQYDDGEWDYYMASEWNERGWIAVRKDEEYGVIDEKGKVIVPFADQYFFHYDLGTTDLIAVERDEGWGYVNEKGETVIPFAYDWAGNFAENGFAAVKKDGLWGYIDRDGNIAIPFQFEDAEEFASNGLAAVELPKGSGSGYIDEKGDLVIYDESYSWCEKFDEYGYAVVYKDYIPWNKVQSSSAVVCVIDDYGREVFSVSVTERDRRFGETYEVQGEKYRLFYTEDYKDYSDMQYGIADETGRPIMPIDNIKYLSVGENHWFAVNKIEEDGEGRKCYYMDKNKNVVLDLSDEYDAVYPFVYVK